MTSNKNVSYATSNFINWLNVIANPSSRYSEKDVKYAVAELIGDVFIEYNESSESSEEIEKLANHFLHSIDPDIELPVIYNNGCLGLKVVK